MVKIKAKTSQTITEQWLLGEFPRIGSAIGHLTSRSCSTARLQIDKCQLAIANFRFQLAIVNWQLSVVNLGDHQGISCTTLRTRMRSFFSAVLATAMISSSTAGSRASGRHMSVTTDKPRLRMPA